MEEEEVGEGEETSIGGVIGRTRLRGGGGVRVRVRASLVGVGERDTPKTVWDDDGVDGVLHRRKLIGSGPGRDW